MTLRAGCRLAVAPHFHLPLDSSARLRLGDGIDEEAGRFFPRAPWRAVAAEELALLTGADAPADESLLLFQLPQHLRAEWWRLLEQSGDAASGTLPGFETFAACVEDFLAFKQLPLPEAVRCEAVVGRPGQRSLRWDAEAGCPAGMSCNLAPWTAWPLAENEPPRLWGGVNLGDEATSLVFVNLSCRQLAEELTRRGQSVAPLGTVGALAECFLRTCADYPPARLILDPGEGFRLPGGGLIVDGCPEDKEEPDVLLLISAGDFE
jgi:hypothetical protein